MSTNQPLKFVPFTSCVDPSFWHKLASLKLDVDRLDEPLRPIWGYYNNIEPRGLKKILSVDCSSFNLEPDVGELVAVGTLWNRNTIDGFKEINQSTFLHEEGLKLKKAIKSDALNKLETLLKFTIISFADLKKHKFIFWFAFPALNFIKSLVNKPPALASSKFSPEELLFLSGLERNVHYQIINLSNMKSYTVKEGFEIMKERGNWFLVFSDVSDDENHPGWPLRNFLALFAYHCSNLLNEPVQVLGLRWQLKDGAWSAAKSLVLELSLSVGDGAWDQEDCCVGWERNHKGAYGPKSADLSLSLNPLVLAESSVDLNLKLMKWQAVPELNLDIVKGTKCLLLGAGTLGCVVARTLLGWGVRHITLVDKAHVSYSNPVRQSLFNFSDVGKPKAPAAANALKAIFPAVVSEGFVISIPMPGHPVGNALLPETEASVMKLDDLIKDHDVIFLLMDSRESRWLPTVMGASHGKLVMNAALGFDSYLVMRHGFRQNIEPIGETLDDARHLFRSSIPGDQLGCYFCSDVTAPGNSGQARTLDQQCTVTRPGISNIAGSLVVELMISVLQHDARGCAPASTVPLETFDCLLGIIPHSIRGFLSRFQTMLPAVEAFSSCVGCSNKVLREYQNKGFEFVHQVLESKKYLEDLTGLSELQDNAVMEDVLALSSEDENDG